jgi:hypothetical protein
MFGMVKVVTMMLAACGSAKREGRKTCSKSFSRIFSYWDESHNVRAKVIKDTFSGSIKEVFLSTTIFIKKWTH